MRFYTMNWWCGNQTDEMDDPTDAYAAHLAAISDRLPPELRATEDSVSLHDTRLRELRLLQSERTLSIELESYACDEKFTLIYSNVESFESTADSEVGLGGPAGYGDLGYTEVNILPSGAFEHRLLFSTGIEFAVVFHGFRLRRTKLADHRKGS